MLVSLAIRDIVLIDRLDLSLEPGLTVLSGETGAGKSIFLDALALCLGARADSRLVRAGCDRGSVTAEFHLRSPNAIRALFEDADLAVDEEDSLIIRRTLTADGRSRALVNDHPVSLALLRDLAAILVEIHGQHDERGLLDSRGHLRLLDRYGDHSDLLVEVEAGYRARRQAQDALTELERALTEARVDEEYLRHAIAELEKVAPQPDEEATLTETRLRLMQAERAADDLAELWQGLAEDQGVEPGLMKLLRRIGRLEDSLRERLGPIAETLERASVELADAVTALDAVRHDLEIDPQGLENAEARLFELRALARKHGCQVDALPDIQKSLADRLAQIDGGEEAVAQARDRLAKARSGEERSVLALRAARQAAGERLAERVMAELPALRMDKARFRVGIEALAQEQWGAKGGERVSFDVATNPGSPFGPLIKIASGGELSRFMLALKVALAGGGGNQTLIFDEIDRGVGGATAAAVGERLARLSSSGQVLVVTHSPQVAALGDQHYHITKEVHGGETRTRLFPLDADARREEIARMLSGAEITPEARAAADSLLAG